MQRRDSLYLFFDFCFAKKLFLLTFFSIKHTMNMV